MQEQLTWAGIIEKCGIQCLQSQAIATRQEIRRTPKLKLASWRDFGQ